MATRWVCPTCSSGVDAPERPRKDDVRRYCLTCSASTGRLVERVSPKLERQRARSAVKSAERATAKREQARSKWIVNSIDAAGNMREINVRSELKRALTSMGFFDGWVRSSQPSMDDIEIKLRRSSTKDYVTGCATQRGFFVAMTIPIPAKTEDVLHLIYHEAAHMANRRGDGHGPGFRKVLAEAQAKRWPWLTHGSLRRPGAYDFDENVRQQMREHVKNGGVL